MSTDPEPRFGLGKSIAYSGILIVLVLGLAELLVRGWAYYLRTDVERFDAPTGTFVLVPGEHRTRFGRVVVNQDGFVGRELQPGGPDLWRMVAVGDSCTFGGGDGVHTYPAILEDRLGERAPAGLRYEVVNAGISGLNSELALRRLRSVVPALQPDVVTIYIGWNDLMKFDPISQGDAGRWSGVARFLDHLWLARGLRKLIFFHVRPRLRTPATGAVSRTGIFEEFRPTYYEDNLRALVATARELGADPLLTTLPTVVRPDMSVDDLREAGVVFPYFRSAYAVGDFLDLLTAYNRAIRRISLEEQVPIVDLERAFGRLPDVRPYFSDTMHTNVKGMRLIALELEHALEREGLLEPAPKAPRRAHAPQMP